MLQNKKRHFFRCSLWNSCSQGLTLTLPTPGISESCIKMKITLNFYFHTSLWCLERFDEALKGLHKTF